VHRRNEKGSWEKIGESLRPSYRDASPKAGANVYRVTAADYENNVSAPSPELEVTAQATAPMATERDPPWVTDRAGYAANVREVHARGAANVRRDVFLFAGDSLTAPALYTQIVGSWLGRGLTVRRGVGTVTTEYGAANIGEYLTEAMPEFAIVMYGTNDVEHGLPNAYSMGNLEAIIDTAIMAGTVPIVATIPPRGYDKRSQEHQERFNSALIELARRKRVPVSYVFEEMMTQDLLAMLYDGVHLQPDTGNDAAGRALSRTMNEVYFALRDNGACW
jgi:lysophospholipase L1-like esterase